MQHQSNIILAYQAFNARDIDAVLRLMQPDVEWPRAWEGDFVKGYDAIRDYWTRQWKELDPAVTPVAFEETADGKLQVSVHQVVHDMQGALLADGTVLHIYTFRDGLIQKMDIEQPAQP